MNAGDYGNGVGLLDLGKDFKPFSNPGPRKEEMEERFALSKDALKT